MKKLILIISVLVYSNCTRVVYTCGMMKELQGHRFTPVYPPPNQQDLQILQRAKEILSDESKWNSDDDRVCNDDDTKWSLFCALKKATIETLGEYDHRRVALMEVRWIIHKLMEGEDFKHRLMDFNNTREFDDIIKVLNESIQKVQVKLKTNPL